MKTKNKIFISGLFLLFFGIAQGQTDQKRVLIHYMGWFDSGRNSRQWSCGQARTPLIGYYSSHSWAVLTYHMLLSWSCGIDGLVINVKDDYDDYTFDLILQYLNWLHRIGNFDYSFSISYDDQGFVNQQTSLPDATIAEAKFTRLRDYTFIETENFLTYLGTPVIFLFQYNKLTPKQYQTALYNVFDISPLLVKNEIDQSSLMYASSFYSWVQPGHNGVWNGTNWGDDYLNWYYNTLKSSYSSSIPFACGGVWAGFNDSPNYCWGSRREMDRQNGLVYDATWSFVNNYTGNPPMKFAYISTWNDWNEGTELEPSVEFGYKYLKSTISNINAFKGTHISIDTVKFEAAKRIFFTADSIEKGLLDSISCYPLLENAIAAFFQNNQTGILNTTYSTNAQLDVSPNPATTILHFKISTSKKSKAVLNILDLNGRVVETVYSGSLPTGNKIIEWDASKLKRGIYISTLTTDKGQIVKKIEFY
jgi:hypothetical protein